MRRTRLGSGLAMLAAVTLAATACAQGDGDKETTSDSGAGALKVELHEPEPAPELPSDVVLPKGDGKGKCSGAKIAYIGTIQGENQALGQNILGGVKLAVNEHNDANPGCQVTLEQFDTQGTPDGAPGVVKQAISDQDVLGVVGLPFSGESKAAGKSFDDAGLVTISPSATNPALAENGWKTFFRGLANDADQGPAAATFIAESLEAEKVCVVSDDSEYGVGLSSQLKKSLGDKVACEEQVKTKQVEFSSVVGNIMNEEPDVVFYAGYYTEGAPFFQQLRDAGSEAVFMGPDGVRDMQYVQNAGSAAEDTLFSCPCLPSEGFGSFAEDYKTLNKAEPSTYSPEGYDATTVLLQGLDQGIKDRPGMLDFVKNYDGQGLTKRFKWDDKGELAETPVWSYRVRDGKIQRYEDLSK